MNIFWVRLTPQGVRRYNKSGHQHISKGVITIASRNQRRQEKYDILIKAGFDAATARRGRDWSWATINERLAGIKPEDTSFVKRSFETVESGIEAYWRKYRLLKSAGYDYKEARKLAKNPPEVIQFLVTIGHQKKEPKTQQQWFYRPFDKGYSQPFAYKVNYELIDDETGEIKNKWITLINHKELTYEEVVSWTLETVQGYGEQFNRILNVIAMQAGLAGGVR
jgi:hypothetical protein